jgi:hypothetical protein
MQKSDSLSITYLEWFKATKMSCEPMEMQALYVVL